MTNHEDRNARANAAMAAANLAEVTVDVDSEDTYYLSGTETVPGREALAVQVALDDGANLVRDGIVSPNAAKPELDRHFAVGENHHVEGAEEDTPEQKILKGADLTDRVFSTPVHSLQTGSPLITR